jgi:hypothetical protein
MPTAPTPLIVNATAIDPYPPILKPIFGELTMDDIKAMVTERDWQLTLAAAHIKALEAAYDAQAEQIADLKAKVHAESGD